MLGWSTAIEGNTVLAGAPAPFGTNHGSAYVFVKPRRGWADETQTAKLTASDSAVNDGFGYMVGLSGDTLVAGSPLATVDGNQFQGAVYVFRDRYHQFQPATVNRRHS